MYSLLKQFEFVPDDLTDFTVVVLSHPREGTVTYYFSLDDFQDNLRHWMWHAWEHGYAVMMYPTSV